MQLQWKKGAISLAVPLLVGALSGYVTQNSREIYETLPRVPLAPAGAVFPVVWTVLYVLMGIAAYLVWTADVPAAQKTRALSVYALQLVVNGLWSVIFFGFGRYGLAFVWLCLLWVLLVETILQFSRISKGAGWLLVPYLLWVTFAGYLNFAIALQA